MMRVALAAITAIQGSSAARLIGFRRRYRWVSVRNEVTGVLYSGCSRVGNDEVIAPRGKVNSHKPRRRRALHTIPLAD
jgi:hypothetical protein